MDFFTRTMAVKLRSHLDKYLIADDDGETVRQSKNGSTHRARWLVELVPGTSNFIRLKTVDGKYLTASDTPFLLGMTGKRVTQAKLEKIVDWNVQWEPLRDGFQVKLQSWGGKFLRANGGTPPWRNSVTHDEPHTGSTVRWILWDVEPVEAVETESVAGYLWSISSFCSVPDDVLEAASDEYFGSDPGSPCSAVSSVATPRLTLAKSTSPRLSPKKTSSDQCLRLGMEFFHNAKTVRLRSYHDKYLSAEEDGESVIQDREGSSKNTKWTVEFVPGSDFLIRLKSCYGKYLTASNDPFLLGMTGRKVIQTSSGRLDSSVEWEPIREACQVKLKTIYSNFLRANGGLRPWRNSVTHDIPHKAATQDWILWDVDVVESQAHLSIVTYTNHQEKTEPTLPLVPRSDSFDFESSSSLSSVSVQSGNFSRHESSESNAGSPLKLEGRTIYYHGADESGDVDDDMVEPYSFHFRGNGVDGLTQKLREKTGLEDIVVCTRSPLNGKLYPLRLQLPPNNADMHVIVVRNTE